MKKRILAGLMCVIFVLSLCGCSEGPLPYNIELIYNKIVKEKVLLLNSTWAAVHWTKLNDDGTITNEFWRDTTSPATRSVIINDIESLDAVFEKYYQKDLIDFKEKMICVLFFTNIARGGEQKIHKVKIEDDILYVDFTPWRPKGEGFELMQDYLVIEMDKTSIKGLERW